MTCDLESLSNYLDGELPPPERSAVSQHMRSCPRCAHALASYRRISAELKTLPPSTAPPRLDAAFYARLDELRPQSPLPFSVLHWFSGFASAAAFASLLLIASLVLRDYASPIPFDGQAAPAAQPVDAVAAVTIATEGPQRADAPPEVSVSTAPEVEGHPPEADLTAPVPAAASARWNDGSPARAAGGGRQQSAVSPGAQVARTPLPDPASQLVGSAERSRAFPAEPSAGASPLAVAQVPGLAPDPPAAAVVAEAPSPAALDVAGTDRFPLSGLGREPGPAASAAASPAAKGRQPPPAAESGTVPASANCGDYPSDRFGLTYHGSAAADQRLGCLIGGRPAITVTMQPFQQGHMLRREDHEGTYVLFANGATWARYQDSRGPAAFPDAVPPISPDHVAPGRHFAPFWRSFPELRDFLGGGVAPERTFSGTALEFQYGTVLESDRLGVYVLYADGSWQGFSQPAALPTPIPQR